MITLSGNGMCTLKKGLHHMLTVKEPVKSYCRDIIAVDNVWFDDTYCADLLTK